MQKFYALIAVLVITISAYATTSSVKHTVKSGEALYIIAQKYHTSIENIRVENSIPKGEILHVGRVLTVPTNTHFSVIIAHEIEDDDTVASIAKKYNSTIKDIREANGLEKGSELEEGDTLKVPENTYYALTPRAVEVVKVAQKETTPKPKEIVKPKKVEKPKKVVKVKKVVKPKKVARYKTKTKIIKKEKIIKYKIRSGDTLYKIARKHGSTTKKVRRANNLKKGYVLKLGKVLRIPIIVNVKTKIKIKIIEKVSVRKKSNKFVTYSIKKGDTIFTIARKHHTTVKEVREANKLKKGTILKLGRELKVPVNTYFSGMAGYLIESGDTLFTIARSHRTTVAEVREVNDIKKGEQLKIGRLLKVPQNTYNPNQTKKKDVIVKKKTTPKKVKIAKYTIKRGDTLSSIARKHYISLDKLKSLNGLKNSTKLRLGRVIKIPRTKANAPRLRLAKAKKLKLKRAKEKARAKARNKIRIAKAKASRTKSSNRNKKKRKKYTLGDIFFSHLNKSSTKKSNSIISLAKKKLGRRYVWGATGGKNTFDCSGLTTYVYKKNGIKLPRRAIAQSKVGKRVSRNNLKKGDLIFFDTSRRLKGYVNHVGIYIGNNKFIHASSAKKKVVITSLNKPFYSQRFRGGRRM